MHYKHSQSSHRPIQTTPPEMKLKKRNKKSVKKYGPYPTDL